MNQSTKNVITSFLRLNEADRLTAYRDSGGVWTIGAGHTGADVHAGEVITIAQEREMLERDLAPIFDYLDTFASSLHIEQTLAYASFAYNCGLGALKAVKGGTAKMEHYIHDRRGNVLGGLVSRRRFELACLGMDITVLDGPAAPVVNNA